MMLMNIDNPVFAKDYNNNDSASLSYVKSLGQMLKFNRLVCVLKNLLAIVNIRCGYVYMKANTENMLTVIFCCKKYEGKKYNAKLFLRLNPDSTLQLTITFYAI